MRALTDRPGKYAILAVNTGAGRAVSGRLSITELPPGETTSFNVVLAHDGARSETGIVLVTVHDADGNEWAIEKELVFPASPRLSIF